MLHKIAIAPKLSKFLIGFMTSCVLAVPTMAAVPSGFQDRYKVNMRVNLKGQSPLSVNTVTKSGKKTFVSQFSDDGQTETLVSVYAHKSQVNDKKGLYMDVQVTKRVRGKSKMTERAQFFAPENQELELGNSNQGRTAGNLSLAVMAHQL